MVLAIILIIMSGIILIKETLTENKIRENSKLVLEELENTVEQYNNSIINKDFSYLDTDIAIGTTYSKKIENINYIGILYFPTIYNLSIPVIDDYTYSNLKKSACRYAGSIEQNNMIIAGHNYKSIFGKLSSKLKKDNIIYFKHLNGIVKKYKLIYTEKLMPKEVKKMQSGKWDLTIFTCTYNGRLRETFRFEITD